MAQDPIPPVSIPSSFLSCSNPSRMPTPQERKRRRLQESGVRIVPCAGCGAPAIWEEVVVRRPDSTLVRVLVRCQGHDTKGSRPCPVRIDSERPIESAS